MNIHNIGWRKTDIVMWTLRR